MRHRHDVDNQKTEQELGLRIKWDDYNLQLLIKKATAEADSERIKDAQHNQKLRDLLETKKLADQVRADRKAVDAKRREGMTTEQMLADVDDPALRRQLIEVMMVERNRTMTPEQILAEAAHNSPSAAEALGRMSDRTRQNAEMLLAEMKKLYADANDRQDKNLKTMLEPAVEAAKRQAAQPQTIVH